MIANLDAAQLRDMLHYNPTSGEFTWIKSNSNRVKVGEKANSQNHGYIRININGKRYFAHRLAFLYVTGSFPDLLVDHINRNTLDNSWKNLREADHKQNQYNRGLRKNNTSGFRNVYWSPQHKAWRTDIYVNGKREFIGVFKEPLQACLAYEKRAREIQGEFYANIYEKGASN